jgi:hypothetical protein
MQTLTFSMYAHKLLSAFQQLLSHKLTQMLANIHINAESEALVVQTSSAFSLLALELATASRAFLPPYISIDGPWWPLVM